MTRLTRKLIRETAAQEGRDLAGGGFEPRPIVIRDLAGGGFEPRPIVIELHPRHLVVRLKGLPTSARKMTYERLLWLAWKDSLAPQDRALVEPRKRRRP